MAYLVGQFLVIWTFNHAEFIYRVRHVLPKLFPYFIRDLLFEYIIKLILTHTLFRVFQCLKDHLGPRFWSHLQHFEWELSHTLCDLTLLFKTENDSAIKIWKGCNFVIINYFNQLFMSFSYFISWLKKQICVFKVLWKKLVVNRVLHLYEINE